MLYKTILFSCLVFAFLSCKDNSNKKLEKKEVDTVAVRPALSKMTKDTAISNKEEATDNLAKIEQKFGEQWDFCKCVVANDSINDALENRSITDAQVDKVMTRMDYVGKKCTEFLTFDQTTPEEQLKHQRKVNKCLKQNGLKK